MRTRLMLLIVIVLVGSGSMLFAQQSSEKPAKMLEFSTTQTPFPEFYLTFQDSVVIGKYFLSKAHDGVILYTGDSTGTPCSISGIFVGDTLKGRWIEPDGQGSFVMTFSLDSSSLEATFYSDSLPQEVLHHYTGWEVWKSRSRDGKRSPILAGLQSLILPGWGQYYNDEPKKIGIYALSATIALLGVEVAFVWAIVDFANYSPPGHSYTQNYYPYYPNSPPPTTTKVESEPGYTYLFWGSVALYGITSFISTIDAVVSAIGINSDINAKRRRAEIVHFLVEIRPQSG